ncbi:lipid A oxidase [Arsenicitalea aurantiaca]|uniref:Lipid A oxidase n=1 Tax=Arsenicitalea aurantiaca TaxID=1783274 RepID=A0A433XB23_9HYPH|nr:outer membrane beta-barrel protein [Arsenicitalea aurantiaca]RUT31208.1 lipid A oxidase [Arsenicitalea aurantiaca]
MRALFPVALATLLLQAPLAGAQEIEFGIYGGLNESAHSKAILSNGTDELVDYVTWEGKSFEASYYYGVKVTYWPEAMADWGFGIDFTHAKAYADLADSGMDLDYSVLEFTDGLNQLTLNAFRKFEFGNGLRAYGGFGAGISIPHVEITTTAANPVVANSETFEFQVTGGVVQAVAGASYEFVEDWRVFGEYKLAYSWNEAQLAGNAGTFSTNLVTHHVLGGVSYSFDFAGF